jgi:hypothetical protein
MEHHIYKKGLSKGLHDEAVLNEVIKNPQKTLLTGFFDTP